MCVGKCYTRLFQREREREGGGVLSELLAIVDRDELDSTKEKGGPVKPMENRGGNLKKNLKKVK